MTDKKTIHGNDRATNSVQENSENYLLSGGIGLALGKLSLPIMATSMIQMAYNLTDMFWVGRLGAAAVAAVGTGGLFMWFADGLMLLARMGGQVLCGQALGAGREQRARDYAAAAVQIGIAMGLLFALVILSLNRPLIGFFRFKMPETVSMSRQYLLVTGTCIVFSYLVRIYTGLMTAAGNSKTPFLVTTIGLLVNMVLDPLLIFVLKMGVFGAALATVSAQLVVLLLFLQAAKSMPLLQHPPLRQLHRGVYARILRIGIPSGLQVMFYAGISIVIAHLVAEFGDLAVAAQRVGTQVESISWLTAEGMAVGINAFVAQNYGARQLKRARRGFHVAALYVLIFSTASTLLLLLLPQQLMSIFVSEAAAIEAGTNYLRILGYSQIFMGFELMTGGAFAGYGETLYPSILIIILTVLRIPMAIFLADPARGLGLNGIWWALTISSTLKGLSMLISFFIFRRRKERHDHAQID